MIKTFYFVIKASNGKYLTSSGDGGVLRATSTKAGISETFQIIDQGANSIAFLASNGKYVSNPQNGTLALAALSDIISANEVFVMNDWGKEKKIVLIASNQMHVSLVPAGFELQAIETDPSENAVLTLEPVDENGNALSPPPETKTQSQKRQTDYTQATISNPSVYTVCFCGTACTRDEGEVTRPQSDKNIYTPQTGYIPVRIHKEISKNLTDKTPSVSIRGVGENDWAVPRNNSEPLIFDKPLNADKTLLNYCKDYSGGDQYSRIIQADGNSAPALALHAANLAAASGKQQFNFIGHSRGAVEAIMAAWFIYTYGSDQVKRIPINIFAIDPVPGPGDWYSIMTQLPPNVANFVGVYAWDMSVQDSTDKLFMGLVPRPNGLMTGKNNNPELTDYWYWPFNKWKYLADDCQLTDPLKPGNYAQPRGYELYAIRGRHSTVAGNATSDGNYNAADVNKNVEPVSELIYKIARGYLTKWGTVFRVKSGVNDRVLALRQHINTFHSEFDVMGGGATRNSIIPFRPYVRRVSSIYGVNPENAYYMDDVVGDPPYMMAYPVTKDRANTGWVNWKFL